MRFVKAKIIDDLIELYRSAAKEFELCSRKGGYCQVTGRGPRANRAYGKWHEFGRVAQSIDDGHMGHGTGRFNKNNLIGDLKKRADYLANTYSFVSEQGSAQVEDKDENVNRNFGEWCALNQIIQDIEAKNLGFR